MANKTDVPQELKIKAVAEGLGHYFPGEAGYTSSSVYVNDTWSDLSGVYKWKGRDDYFTTLSELTGIQSLKDIKKATFILDELERGTETTTEVPEYKAESNTVSTDQLQQFQKELEQKETARQKIIDKTESEVRASIKRQQEIYAQEIEKTKRVEAKLKNQKIYYKVEEAPTELKQQAEADPKKFVKDAVTQFEKSPVVQDLPPEEAKIVVTEAALTTYEAFTEKSPIIQVAILEQVVSDPQTPADFKDVASILIDQKNTQLELAKQFINLPENINVEFSNTPQEGFKEFDLSQIPSEHLQNLTDQNNFLGNIKGLGEGEIRSQILSNVGVRIESQIAKLPVNSLIAQTYRSDIAQFGFRSLGIAQAAPVAVAEGSLVGKVIVGSGFGPTAGFIQAKTGINLGIKLATKVAISTGTKVAVGGTTAAAGATAGAAVGTAVAPVVGTAIGFVVGLVGPKAVGWIKDNVSKFGKYIVAGTAALIGGAFFGTPGAIIGGLGGFFGTSLLSGGLPAVQASLSSAGSGIASFGSALAGATLGAIGLPILVTLLVFPVVVTLILFIINSGAYVVPPAPLLVSSGAAIISPYIDVVKTPTPPGPFKNEDLPLTVEYTISIKAKKGSLQNITIDYECNVVKAGGSVACPEIDPEISDPPENISPASPYVFKYKQTYNAPNYKDSLIVDTITVTADSPDQRGAIAAGSAGVKIGNPPDTCPSNNIWPLEGGHTITQTPGGGFSHQSVEAIDLSASMGTPVKATHSGIATVVHTSNAYRPLYIDIASNCGGKPFVSRYAHLSSTSIISGQQVTMGQTIGTTGSAGTGPHLHYEFRGLRMEVPYIPKPIIRNCSDDGGKCGSIP